MITDGTHSAHYLVNAIDGNTIKAAYTAQPGDSAAGDMAKGARVVVSGNTSSVNPIPSGKAGDSPKATTSAAFTIPGGKDGLVFIKVDDASGFSVGCQDAYRLKNDIASNMGKQTWLKHEQSMIATIRRNYQMLPIRFGAKATNMDDLIDWQQAGLAAPPAP